MRLFSPVCYATCIHNDFDLQFIHSYFQNPLKNSCPGYIPTLHLLPLPDHLQVCQRAQVLSLETLPASFSRDSYSYLSLPSFVFLKQSCLLLP